MLILDVAETLECSCSSANVSLFWQWQLIPIIDSSGGTLLNLLLFSRSSDCQGCPPQAADELVLRHGAGSEAELTLVTSEFRLPTILSIFGRFLVELF